MNVHNKTDREYTPKLTCSTVTTWHTNRIESLFPNDILITKIMDVVLDTMPYVSNIPNKFSKEVNVFRSLRFTTFRNALNKNSSAQEKNTHFHHLKKKEIHLNYELKLSAVIIGLEEMNGTQMKLISAYIVQPNAGALRCVPISETENYAVVDKNKIITTMLIRPLDDPT